MARWQEVDGTFDANSHELLMIRSDKSLLDYLQNMQADESISNQVFNKLCFSCI